MLARTLTLGIAIAAAITMAGCATRYDAQGDRIYIFQFGQDVQREVDYSNPRMPILPEVAAEHGTVAGAEPVAIQRPVALLDARRSLPGFDSPVCGRR